MKKIFLLMLFFTIILSSCGNLEEKDDYDNKSIEKQVNNNSNNEVKNGDNVPLCSDLPEGSNEQCSLNHFDGKEDLDNNQNNLDNNQDNMKNTYQTELPKEGDLVAIMKTTNGIFKIRLFQGDVPTVVNNFVGLASQGYYDGLIFHRVINNFMIQGGDPTGTGMGGESIYGEKFDDEFSDKLSNIRGSISMANSGPNTNGSQFFINQVNNENLDYDKTPLTSKHAVFGQVYEGIENIDKIAKTKTGENNKPEKDVKIISVEIKEMGSGSLVDYDVNEEELLSQYNKIIEEKKEANKNREVKQGDIISVNYTLKLEDGTIFDTSLAPGRTPLDFEVGKGKMIVGLEKGVLGMKIGEKKTINIKAKDAYGEYDESNSQEVNISDLKSFTDAGIKIEKGAVLQTMQGNFKVKSVDGDKVTIDTNNELAGKNLIFEIEMVDFKN